MDINLQLRLFWEELNKLSFENGDWQRLYDLTAEIKTFAKEYVPHLKNDAKLNHDILLKISTRLSKQEQNDTFNECKRNAVRDVFVKIK